MGPGLGDSHPFVVGCSTYFSHLVYHLHQHTNLIFITFILIPDLTLTQTRSTQRNSYSFELHEQSNQIKSIRGNDSKVGFDIWQKKERPFGDDEVQVSFLEIILRLGGELRDDASLFLRSRGEIADGVFNHEICRVRDRHVSIQ